MFPTGLKAIIRRDGGSMLKNQRFLDKKPKAWKRAEDLGTERKIWKVNNSLCRWSL